jgi:hypothetical protein
MCFWRVEPNQKPERTVNLFPMNQNSGRIVGRREAIGYGAPEFS